MIKAKKKGEYVEMKFSGSVEDIANELTCVVSRVADMLMVDLNSSHNAITYAMIMTFIDKIEEDGHKVDRKTIGRALITHKD